MNPSSAEPGDGTFIMKIPWSTTFWFQLRLWPKPTTEKGIIASYRGVNIFLTVKNHVIGLNGGQNDYLGPKITGLENTPWIFFCLTKGKLQTTLYLNGMKAMEVADRKIVYKLENFQTEVSDKNHIQKIEQDLSKWIKKRESMFKIKRETSNAHLILSSKDQQEQLRNRVLALQDLLHYFHEGKTYFFEDISANLRSLIFYKNKNPNYDPLLLRVAAFKKITLPVYVMPEYEKHVQSQVADSDEALKLAGLLLVEVKPKIPCVKMVDFQEFVEKPAIFYEGEFVSPLELIERIATTQSTAHFDQRVPRLIEGIKDTPIISGHNILEHYILTLAELVTKLGHSVLDAK
ncbi:hypothetical protein ACFL1R_12015 [Candidatus Latescibacterota bacterium]